MSLNDLVPQNTMAEQIFRAQEAEIARLVIDEANFQLAIERSRLEYEKTLPGYEPTLADDLAGANPWTAWKDEELMSKLLNNSCDRAMAEAAKDAEDEKGPMKYPTGALRITRTPGREHVKNCVNLEDVIQKEELVSACCHSFVIGQEELYQHLPFSFTNNDVPIYIGRDIDMDPNVQVAYRDPSLRIKLTKCKIPRAIELLQSMYQSKYGKNYHAFYTYSPGSTHSKILFLVYPEFARLVIMSCNIIDTDTRYNDNHWYIHDLPKLAIPTTLAFTPFEADLLGHFRALGTPPEFVNAIRGQYDYSKVKVHLVTSVPGVCSGPKAEKYGLLRLRKIVKDLDLDLESKHKNQELQLDLCSSSIGNLSVDWVNGFFDCALGKESIKVNTDDVAFSNLKIFYPTVGDVQNTDLLTPEVASAMGCHIRNWGSAPSAITDLFHHYKSIVKDILFHQKLIVARNPQNALIPPYYIYVGSANLSQSAWGALTIDKKKNEKTCDTKLIKMTNFECGVVVPGHLIPDLVEKGSFSWQAGLVPFCYQTKKYDLSRDRPWNGEVLDPFCGPEPEAMVID